MDMGGRGGIATVAESLSNSTVHTERGKKKKKARATEMFQIKAYLYDSKSRSNHWEVSGAGKPHA